MLKIPEAPRSIQKGFPLKMVLDKEAVSQLAENLHHVHASFNKVAFVNDAMNGINELSITQRSIHIADAMHTHLPENTDLAHSIFWFFSILPQKVHFLTLDTDFSDIHQVISIRF